MRIGIIVVYMFNEANTELFNIHLKRIQKHTKNSYKIYSSINKLPTNCKKILDTYPNIKQYIFPDLEMNNAAYEHAYLLGELVKKAVLDGVDYCFCLHLDSFPVKDFWDEEIINKIEQEKLAFVSTQNFDSSCIAFSSKYYETYKPEFLLSIQDTKVPICIDFIEKHVPRLFDEFDFNTNYSKDKKIGYTGVGFGYSAYKNHLNWHFLKRNSKGSGLLDSYQQLFGNMIFHLGGATRFQDIEDRKSYSKNHILKTLLSPIFSLYKKLKKYIPFYTKIEDFLYSFLETHIMSAQSVDFQEMKKQLIANDELFFQKLLSKQ